MHDFFWTYQNDFLRVTSLEKNGEARLLSKFNFARLLKDKSVYITNVTEFKEEHYLNDCFNFCKYKLLVSLNHERSGSYLLIVDVKNQCIAKCIDCPFRIRNIEPIANNSGKQDNSLPFCSELQAMCGIVALSTANASVMIMDLCLDSLGSFDINDPMPSAVTFIVKNEGNSNNYDPETKRKVAKVHNQHICITINDDCSYKNDFRYDSDEEHPRVYQKHDVYISSLKYFYQTNTLYIGYNFGGVHHFSLQTLSIYQVDPLDDTEDECMPVVGFSLQEPENDPKNFCYLWVMKGQLVQDLGTLNQHNSDEESFSICSVIDLNVLEFTNKNWIENYGYLYSDFVMASPRFEYLLTSNAFDQTPMSSIIVNYGVIHQGSILSYRKSKEDTTLDSSLFYAVWQAFDDQTQSCTYYLMLFDLNQWYQAQMPFSINIDAQFSSFASFYKLNEIITQTDSGDFHDAKIDQHSFSRYQQNNINDIFYYPSSLSFKVSLLSETKHLAVTYLSMQKKILKLLNDENDAIWLQPDEFLNKCHFAGILSVEEMNSMTKSKRRKYEQILSIALDNNELPFLSQTILSWSGSSSELDKHGCSCKLFLDWLWNEVETIKKSIDEIVVPLFDLSDTYDAKQVLSPLYANESKLKCLLTLLNKLKSSGTPTTEQGERELDLRVNIIQILIDYVQIILWCCSCGLLPEAEEGNHLTTVGFIYPKTQFQVDYDERRKELVSLNSSLIKHSDLLTIDGIILNTKPVHDLWTTNENPSGLYPPPSIYSLVSMYLEDSVSTEIKHQIMFYVLQDLILYLSNRQDVNQVERLESFQSCFNVSSSVVQSVQGMWALDHQQFDYSLSYFCEANTKLTFPNLADDFKKLDDDLQRRILTSYLYQSQNHHSLQFIKSSNLFQCDTLTKQKLYISVMLSNKLILEAYNFQRACRNKDNVEELLFHFFLGCEEMKLFETLFKFALDPLEKDTLIYYLLELSPNSGNLLIVYLLLNKKFVDAHKFLSIIEERINNRNLDQDSAYNSDFQSIKSLVNSYIQVLPSSVVRLNLEVNNHAENLTKKKSICNLPSQKPKHVQISRSNSNNEECSNAVKEILHKISALSDQPKATGPLASLATTTTKSDRPTTPFRKRIEERGLLLSENSPFVKDLTPKKDKSELKNSMISSYSLNYNGDNSFLDNSATTFNRLDSSRNVENCSELLSLLATPKIEKQQKHLLSNDYVPSISGPPSILKSKHAISTPHSLTKSSRKKKSTVSSKLSFHQDKQHEKAAAAAASTEDDMIVDSETDKQHDGHSETQDSEQNTNDMSIDPNQSNARADYHHELLRTPMNPSFVFSPPLTRSRKKQGKFFDSKMINHLRLLVLILIKFLSPPL